MGHGMMRLDLADPKGLVRESYRIETITDSECRSIFVDWALSLDAQVDPREAMRVLLATYGLETPDHPMTKVLTEGLQDGPAPRRRGGRGGRTSHPV
ncbi:hypothetical protein GCM10008024_12140 [Allgaiera indica]|uniref:Uncharacterized protein n=2 Tax=Allgaiera indica TaxID=765699 RepID=A0AAN4ZZ35_9RHOB|nr:hypothetical protein GCM10008024_12140 [Allgaiera indica]SDW61331.1 hypothetical protein SAMN05444006_105102 [Allgaiera indica]